MADAEAGGPPGDGPPRREFPVGDDEGGTRLETFLRRRLGLARPAALKALRKGWVRVDGRRAKGPRRLEPGEVVKITNYALPLPAVDAPAAAPLPAVPDAEVARARASLRLEDPEVVVAAKPAGAPTHRGSRHPWGWADALGRALGETAPAFPLTPVGRLDRDTSGLLALARTRGGARRLFEQLRSGRLRRRYLALAAGAVPGPGGRIDLPLAKAGRPGEERMEPRAGGRAAATRYRVLERAAGATLLELELETGRTHQIRAHLAARGHPVLGDARYADGPTRELARRLGLERLFLHAGALELEHPTTGEALAFDEPLPADLEAALRRAR